MRPLALCFAATIICLLTTDASASRISATDREYQDSIWERWWGSKLEWRFDKLPENGMVDKFRMPYAGAIYPDKSGGTERVLRKYDLAFYGRSQPATQFERRDIEIHKEMKRGLIFRRLRTPNWAGHCNGWSAAAIRHAEPAKNIVRNGVEFTPADIKALLAELYTYTEIEELGGSVDLVHPAMLHVMLTNWIGIGKHPIAMDEAIDEEIWNYPIYGYSSSSAKRGDHRVEVKVNIGYVHYTDGEYIRAPDNHRFLYFHYSLDLDNNGEIIGGQFYRDSNKIDLLWVPLQPTKGGEPGNEAGNPYMDVDEVLSMWRESAPQELRNKWYNINPTEHDRVVEPEEVEIEAGDIESPDAITDEPLEPIADAPNDVESGVVEDVTVDDPTVESVIEDDSVIDGEVDVIEESGGVDDAESSLEDAVIEAID